MKIQNNTPLVLVAGGKYRNNKGYMVHIVRELSPSESGYTDGNRFVDDKGTLYTENGRFMAAKLPHGFDLAGQLPDDYIETIDSTTVVEELPGFFGRIYEKARANPVKTTLIVGAGAGATYVGVKNYQEFGNPIPPRVLGFLRRNNVTTASI